jgi:uncharacterized membrane protein YkgB
MSSFAQTIKTTTPATRLATIEATSLAKLGTYISRYALVLVLFWIGLQKFTPAEAQGIQPLISHSPFTSWMYSILTVQGASRLIGSIEITLALLMALRPLSARAAFLGAAGAIFTFLGTTSFLFSTPGVLDHTYSVPFLSGVGAFLIKDLALLGCAVSTAAEAKAASDLR